MAFFMRMIEGKAPKDHVFRSDKGEVWQRQHSNLFRRAVRDTNLPPGFVFHGLRHTYASDLIRQGVPIEVVARQLGHANIRTVADTYGHIAEQFREEQIRTRFSALDDSELRAAQPRAGQLDALWHQVRTHDLRSYAATENSHQRRPRSLVRTPRAVLEAFEGVIITAANMLPPSALDSLIATLTDLAQNDFVTIPKDLNWEGPKL